MKKHLSLIVVPHDNANVRNYKFSYLLVYSFAALVGVAVLTMIVLFVTYSRVFVKAQQASGLAAENARLIDRAASVDSLESELTHLRTMGVQIKSMLGIGLSAEDSTLVANLSPDAGSPAIAGTIETADATEAHQKLLLKAVPSMWPVKGYVTREFHVTGGEKNEHFHPGIDIAAKRNTPVRASAEGVVIASGRDETYGYLVVIDHGFGITTVYGHNARNLVNVGDRVTRGQTIAFLGSTGKSTAPHVHFEVKQNGVPVDPRKYLLN
jgi:murein DD-endopeptidase MepM/ murein hydrolase activator NlpD